MDNQSRPKFGGVRCTPKKRASRSLLALGRDMPPFQLNFQRPELVLLGADWPFILGMLR